MNTTIKAGLAAILLFANACKKESGSNLQSSLTDDNAFNMVAGKYPSVWIGTQKWMTRNLDVTHYRNGDRIPQVNRRAVWDTITRGAWCWYNEDSTNDSVYGKLYNWYAVNDPRGLAPKGWHVPSDAEWDTLSSFLGGDAVAGGKLKETGTAHWGYPNAEATNETGFTGLPGGSRRPSGKFVFFGVNGEFWTSTQYKAVNAWFRYLLHYNGSLSKYVDAKQFGFSVRCIKD